MSMNIGMSRNLDAYKEEVLPGMDVRETLFTIAAFAVGGIAILVFHIGLGISIQLSIYCAIPFLFPVIMAGFSKQRGLYYNEIMKLSWYQWKSKKVLLYETGENETQIETVKKQLIQDEKQKSFGFEEEWKQLKIKIMAVIAAVILIVTVLSVILCK